MGRARYDKVSQRVDEKYRKWGDQRLPVHGEEYSSRFDRTRNFDWKFETEAVLKTALEAALNKTVETIDLRAHRMGAGHYLRAHKDHEVGSFGFTVNLNKRWVLDWGGILMALEKDLVALAPTFNELVVMDAETPHFVTRIAEYAKEERLGLVGFARCG